MQMNHSKKIVYFVILGTFTFAFIVQFGCEATARSDRAEPRWQTTASYDKIISAKTEPSPIKPRQWSASQASYQEPAATHFGSYFDDEFVTAGDGDDAYGWTWRDTVAVFYCPVRFGINALAVPVSMVKEPPGVLVTTNMDEPENRTAE